jgi:FkbM family methyltransferase
MAAVEKSFWKELVDDNFKVDIIDIGAAEGDEIPSYKPIMDLGIADLIGFEPNEEACQKLNKINQGNSRYLPYFIGDGKVATFYETNRVQTGSLYPPNSKLLEKFNNLSELTTLLNEHQIKTFRLDDIKEIKKADFLKMDVQGSELKILQNATNILKNCLVIQVEVEFVEMYKGQPLFADVDTFLRSKGYQFHCFDGHLVGRTFKPLIVNNDKNKEINQGLWADAFYVKDWMQLEQLTKKQLVTFAILSYSLLGSIDLTHVILSQIDKISNTNYAPRYLKILTSN